MVRPISEGYSGVANEVGGVLKGGALSYRASQARTPELPGEHTSSGPPYGSLLSNGLKTVVRTYGSSNPKLINVSIDAHVMDANGPVPMSPPAEDSGVGALIGSAGVGAAIGGATGPVPISPSALQMTPEIEATKIRESRVFFMSFILFAGPRRARIGLAISVSQISLRK